MQTEQGKALLNQYDLTGLVAAIGKSGETWALGGYQGTSAGFCLLGWTGTIR